MVTSLALLDDVVVVRSLSCPSPALAAGRLPRNNPQIANKTWELRQGDVAKTWSFSELRRPLPHSFLLSRHMSASTADNMPAHRPHASWCRVWSRPGRGERAGRGGSCIVSLLKLLGWFLCWTTCYITGLTFPFPGFLGGCFCLIS